MASSSSSSGASTPRRSIESTTGLYTHGSSIPRTKKKHRRPWSYLPEDILRLVLEEAHALDHRFGVAASQVCSYWRAVALTTPRLWTHISTSRTAEAIIWLQRSRAVPIELTMLNKSYEDTLSTSLLRPLVANLHRVRKIDIRIFPSGNPLWIRQLFLAFDQPALLLESLAFELQMPFPWPQVSSHTTLFGGIAPRLASLTVKLPQDEPGWITPFFTPALTQLTLAQTSDLQMWAIWERACNLRQLRMEDITWFDVRWHPVPPIIVSLPKLESLSLRRAPRGTAVTVLGVITAPSLTYLSIDLRHPPDRQAGLDIVNALKRSRLPLRQLRTLRIQVAACQEEECLELLAQLENVERLSFYNADMDTWLQALEAHQPSTDGSKLVCPKLRELVLNICELNYANAVSLAARRRWGYAHNLCAKVQKVSLQFCHYTHMERTTSVDGSQPEAEGVEILLALPWSARERSPLSSLWYSEY